MALSNVQYDAVMRHYDEVRERRRYEQTLHTERIYREIPEMMSLDDEIASRSLHAARARIEDPAADLSDYSTEMTRIISRKKELLKCHGYSPDYLELQYDCPRCRDTGLVNGKHCSCFDRTAAELLYGTYSLKGALDKENFSRFSFEWYSDTMVDETTGMSALGLAYEAAEAAHAMFRGGRIRGNLYLYGNTGVGKTFLTHCIAKEALDAGLAILCFSAADLFDTLAECTFDRTSSGGNVLKNLVTSSDLLIIDDLGTELTNAFSASELFRIVNERISLERSTVISTNLALKDLRERYSERVLSRIMSEYTIKKLIGADIRIQKKLSGGRL